MLNLITLATQTVTNSKDNSKKTIQDNVDPTYKLPFPLPILPSSNPIEVAPPPRQVP